MPSSAKDQDRALTAAGRTEVEAVAETLLRRKIKFDKIVTSPLKRALETAEIVAKVMKVKDSDFEKWDELKPEGQRSEFFRKLTKLRNEVSSVLVVGHEPGLSSMVGEIISSGSTAQISLRKSGIAKVRLIDFATNTPKGELRWLLTPNQLKDLD